MPGWDMDAVGDGSSSTTSSSGGSGLWGIGSIGGRIIDYASMQKQAARNVDNQRDFAQHGIQWRVKDAEAAGLHPLYALGASPTSFSPQGIFNPGVGDMARTMGQDLSRAARATMTDEQRRTQDLQNGLLMAQTEEIQARTALHRRDLNPAMPSVDQATGVPAKITSISGTDSAVEAGPPRALLQPFTVRQPDARGRGGLQMYLPSSDATEPLESVSESWPMTVGLLMENERRRPGFLWDLVGPYLPDGFTVPMEGLAGIIKRAIEDSVQSNKMRRNLDWRYRKYQPR